jgi:dipeptidyl aminopeptidase/acylaminoacyl peptidase
MFQAKCMTTPTLIQHGEKDARVPVSQGQELYNALKKQSVPVRMVIYPRQEHGVNEPRLFIDVRKQSVQWLEHWILGK